MEHVCGWHSCPQTLQARSSGSMRRWSCSFWHYLERSRSCVRHQDGTPVVGVGGCVCDTIWKISTVLGVTVDSMQNSVLPLLKGFVWSVVVVKAVVADVVVLWTSSSPSLNGFLRHQSLAPALWEEGTCSSCCAVQKGPGGFWDTPCSRWLL